MKQILAFGDSNTYGYKPDGTGRFGWGVRWTSILSEKLNDQGSEEEIRVIEEGLVGRTTVFDDPLRKGRNGAELLPVILETHRPLDAVIVMLGTNDCKTVYGASPAVIGKGIEVLIKQIREYSPSSRILLVSPIELGEKVYEPGFDQEFSPSSVAVSKKLGDVYKEIAESYKVDFLKGSDYARPSEIDREHLDEEGHKKISEGIYCKLKEIDI
ncbi:MAG: SGNH/GDSL hydrolase family protein [Eubacteriales bacterium]|nr:SGNH/GDSL hydrolase family protein [Eubacteriales bacterium]